MNKDKVLLIIEPNDKEDIFFSDWIRNGYQATVLFKRVNKLSRAVRRLSMKNGICQRMWLNDWFYDLNKYEAVILHMSRLTRYLPELISKTYPDLKVICWYRNTVDEDSSPFEAKNSNIQYWSFDYNDCMKYGMKQNIQYYCNYDVDNSKEKEWDIYFVGYGKGREKQIKEFEETAQKKKLVCDFHVVKNNDDGFIPYSQVRKDLNKTRAILEINKENQVGFTIRVMESLFYGIKLITNNAYIKKSPIYNKNNIFVIGEDSYDDLTDFVNGNYDHSVDYLRKQYDLDAWFNNFFI